MKKNLTSLFLASLITMTALTGCAVPSTDQAAAPAAEPASEEVQESETAAEEEAVVLDGVTLSKKYAGTKLSFVGGGGTTAFGKCTEEYLHEFEEATGIDVELESLTDVEISRKLAIDSAAGGEGLDVFMIRPAQETKAFVHNGWIKDLTALTEDQEYDFADISEESLRVCTVDDTVYAIPVTVEHTMLFYNTKWFEEAGIDHAPATLDELVEVCEKLTDPDQNKYALCMRGQGTAAVIAFAPFMYAMGGQFIDENNQAVFNSPEAIKAFEYYADLINKYCPEGTSAYTTSEASAMMRLGDCAMYIDYDSHYAFIVDDETSNITDVVAYAPFPEGPAGFTPTGPVAWAIGVAANTKNPEASDMFIKWITSKGFFEKAAKYGQISGRASCTTPEILEANFGTNYAEVVAKTAPVANPYDRPVIINGTEARQIVGEVIDYANAGHTGDDLKAFADDACARVQALIDSE